MTYDKAPHRHDGVVLIVDDDDGVREAMRDALTDESYQVACAADGREALAYLESGPPPCLVLLDLTMPGMNGWELLDHLAQKPALAAIPVIVVTGASPAQRALVSATRVMSKPIELDVLLANVEAHC